MSSKQRKLIRWSIISLLIALFIILLTILIIWVVLQPKKPHFILQDATVYAFNLSSTAPYFLSSNFQVTISSRNPNKRIGIYYDKLDVYATYRTQQITYYTATPPEYQGHKEVIEWSPFLYGTDIPVAPASGASLSQDQANGAIWLMIKLNGRVRWKVGSFTSGRYHLRVECPAYIPLSTRNTAIAEVGTSVKYQLVASCKVTV
ncbi:putative Late embryogenesis abundant protein, LEA-14 [Heracleum sosnowskyi]|uniref:Late embryogenesis abundant protein, LEA-14 n=1 Tax=Heracleum sosnowskyi TaxID=360622 RepID=A0AAD8IRP3_9APIA|nr:putative Late embryogenesis abundant protein, LEA-14 [Heracleum sosnowskyi]